MLGKYTGPVRDIDVYLLKLDKYQKNLSKQGKKQLKAFKLHLQELRKEKQAALKETLKSSEYKQAMKSWDEYLQQPVENLDENSPQARPVSTVADKLVWELYQQTLEQGNVITPESPADDIHTLRKTCKKLRYVMEFFQSLYPARRIRELILVLKGLQDVLGDFNDYAVHIDMLKEFRKSVPEESVEKAMTAMIKELKKKQAAVRAGFAEQYAQYSSQDHIDEFREIFVDSR
jgi:CHAD domain-containing protein